MYNRCSMLGALAGIAAAAAGATFAGLHSMVPRSQLYGANFNGAPPGTRTLALTYDDGPNDPYTGQLLEVLNKHGVKATFFLLGQFVSARPELARAVVEAGHAVGSHGYTHRNLIFVSSAELRRQLERASQVIEAATGVRPKLFRPPFGGRRPGTFSAVREFGMVPVMWRVTCYDWSARSHQSIVARAVSGIRGGDVILLHDGGHLKMGTDRSHTVRATGELVHRYQDDGYRFVTVPEMMAGNGAQ
jgi:peptidoglycan/xylan/chitin deacetylase (PgdA/CDA1 family)